MGNNINYNSKPLKYKQDKIDFLTKFINLAETRFWEKKTLDEMNYQEWEALCDGCGKCCLEKLEDEDTNIIYTTAVSCRLLDCNTCKCTSYNNRFNLMSDCIKITPKVVKSITWLPKTCAYNLIKQNKPLPSWHPLITMNPSSTLTTKNSAKEFAVHPYTMTKPLEEYIIEENE